MKRPHGSVAALLLAVLVGLSTPLAAAQPLADYARLPEYGDLKLSPNGDYLAVTVPLGAQTAIAVLQTSDLKVVGTVSPPERLHFYEFWWVGPKRLVAAVAESAGPLERPVGSGELVAFNADGSDRKYLAGVRSGDRVSATMIDPLPEEPEWALISVISYFDDLERKTSIAYKVNVNSGRLSREAVAPVRGLFDFLPDQRGKVRYVVGPDPNTLLLRTFVRPTDDAEWLELDGEDTEFSELYPLRISADGKRAYLAASNKEGFRCLVEQSLASGDMVARACHPRADLSDAWFTPKGDAPVAAVFDPGIPEVSWVDESSPAAQDLKSLAASFPEQVMVPTSSSLDGQLVTVLVYSDKNPGEYYLFDRRTGKARFLLSPREWIDPKQMADRYPVTWKSADGTTINGYLTVPPGQAPKNLPLVVIPHGGPFGIRDYWEWESDSQMLASRGYAVLQPNFRGSGGFGATYEESARQGWGTMMIDDVVAGVNWAVRQKIADPARMCIYGGSYGGYAALMASVREPDLFKCAIGYVGVYDIPSFKRGTDTSSVLYGRNYLRAYVSDDPAQSPLSQIDKLKAPFFIVAAEDDTRVPYSQSKQLRAALEERGHPHEWMSKPNEGHGYYNQANRAEFYERMLGFLNQHIGSGHNALATPSSASTGQQ